MSLHNAILFKHPANYNEANDRVTVRGATTIVSEVVDNDYTTYSAEDDVDVNIADADGNATRVDAMFVKCSGVDSHRGDPTGGSGSGWTARTITDTVENYAGDDVDTTVSGFQHDLLLLGTHFTATSVRLRFTGSDIKIYAVMLLEIVAQWDVNRGETFGIEADYVRQPGRVLTTPQGSAYAIPSYANARRKWEVDYSVKVIPGETNIESVSGFLETLKANRQCAFAQEFSRYPARVFPAAGTSRAVSVQQRGNAKPLGELLNFRIQER